ncbi:Ig-like domain-containing protein [Leucobacter allii]|uniref:Ig-like domain-containing protein n=1 Tax=Leucobacter allii TaxID=2932247 RepID=UPI001FD2733A|nr:Ig-like domain-containing protein [Leucobacter allii]UOR01566.1 Ig-like domain-containing protein [Leucobacter allii]
MHAASTSEPVVLGVERIGTATELAIPAGPLAAGDPAHLRATVLTDPAGDAASGEVEFFAGGVPLGTAELADGVATLEVTTLEAGSHEITAAYAGDATHASSTSAVAMLEISPAPRAEPPGPVDPPKQQPSSPAPQAPAAPALAATGSAPLGSAAGAAILLAAAGALLLGRRGARARSRSGGA